MDVMLAVGFEKMEPGSLEASQGPTDDRVISVRVCEHQATGNEIDLRWI